jgi:hypothetical protein
MCYPAPAAHSPAGRCSMVRSTLHRHNNRLSSIRRKWYRLTNRDHSKLSSPSHRTFREIVRRADSLLPTRNRHCNTMSCHTPTRLPHCWFRNPQINPPPPARQDLERHSSSHNSCETFLMRRLRRTLDGHCTAQSRSRFVLSKPDAKARSFLSQLRCLSQSSLDSRRCANIHALLTGRAYSQINLRAHCIRRNGIRCDVLTYRHTDCASKPTETVEPIPRHEFRYVAVYSLPSS